MRCRYSNSVVCISPKRRFAAWLVLLCLSGLSSISYAQQYRSHEIFQPASAEETKSIADLERELKQNSITNAFAASSTARFLARHFASADADKAMAYYRASLQGDGFSIYAKQEVYLELAQLALQQKDYQQALDAIDERSALGAKATALSLQVKALAQHFLGQAKAAVITAELAWGKVTDIPKVERLPLLQQLRFVFFYNNAYAQAAKVQQQLLAFDADDLQGWRYLSAIYIKQGNYAEAANSLAIARYKNLAMQPADYQQLIALYGKSANPYAAATTLEELMAAGALAKTSTQLTVLMNYWLMAKETAKAITVLQQILSLDASAEGYLQLAQLYQQQQQWPEMRQAVIAACENSLPDRYISQANLLLGVSELKQGHYAQARNAFINATMIGGQIDAAKQYLLFMQAEALTADEQADFNGVCTPAWAKAEDYFLPADDGGFFSQEAEAFAPITRIDYQLVDVPEQTLVASFHQVPVAQFQQEIRPLAMRLGMFIGKNEGQINGPLHFIFPERMQLGQSILTFTLAFPVRRKPFMKGSYRLINDKGFKVARAIFSGEAKDFLAFWMNFERTLLADDLELTGESRQIILDAKSAARGHLKIELQWRLR